MTAMRIIKFRTAKLRALFAVVASRPRISRQALFAKILWLFTAEVAQYVRAPWTKSSRSAIFRPIFLPGSSIVMQQCLPVRYVVAVLQFVDW